MEASTIGNASVMKPGLAAGRMNGAVAAPTRLLDARADRGIERRRVLQFHPCGDDV